MQALPPPLSTSAPGLQSRGEPLGKRNIQLGASVRWYGSMDLFGFHFSSSIQLLFLSYVYDCLPGTWGGKRVLGSLELMVIWVLETKPWSPAGAASALNFWIHISSCPGPLVVDV